MRHAILKMIRPVLPVVCILALLLASGCGVMKDTGEGKQEEAETVQSEQLQDREEPAGKTEETKEQESGQSQETDLTLAQRLCGKYSAYGDGEWMGIEIVSFGENLYAYAGSHMIEEGEEDPEEFSYYSFWAYEFFPVDPAELNSTTSDSVEMYRVTFSIMSYAGKYQDVPQKGTLSLKDDGLVMDGFGGGKIRLVKDDRAEDTFTYAKGASNDPEDADLQGYWRSMDEEEPVYLDFDKNRFYLLSKEYGSEVYFAGGSVKAEDGQLQGLLSVLGSGSMPAEFSCSYRVDQDRLLIEADEYGDIRFLDGNTEYEKISAGDIPVFTADRALAYVPGETDVSALFEDDPLQEKFYGIFVGAQTNQDPAITLSEKVSAKGFDSMVIYSPEWENLSAKPVFCVTAGRYATEQEATDALDAVKKEYPDAYVKYSGACKGTHMTYTNSGMGIIDVNEDYAILQNIYFSTTFQWDADEDRYSGKTWIVDEDTVFDPNCETEFFGNYEDGDTPLSWIRRNDELLKNDPDAYAMYGPAFDGVFDVIVTGNHIDAFLGSYWWD
ncbi:MAG: SPOR domain-containing protein [Lachnospiraceae bacterium]|nr:SPOR domain-containing protein [Lachnospiraceae bacterium]